MSRSCRAEEDFGELISFPFVKKRSAKSIAELFLLRPNIQHAGNSLLKKRKTTILSFVFKLKALKAL